MPAIFEVEDAKWNYLVNYSDRLKYIYVEVPKTGCTTVKRALQLGEVDGDESRLGSNLHDRSSSPLLAPLADRNHFNDAWESGEYLRFCFVRNPFTRTLSAYLDKLVNNEWERNRRLPKLGLTTESNPTFGEFLELIRLEDPVSMDIHWAPQTTLLGLENNDYDRVFRFERFRYHTRTLLSYLGILNCAQDLVDSLPAHATSAKDRLLAHYGEQEIKLVNEIYAADFERLGYHESIDRAF